MFCEKCGEWTVPSFIHDDKSIAYICDECNTRWMQFPDGRIEIDDSEAIRWLVTRETFPHGQMQVYGTKPAKELLKTMVSATLDNPRGFTSLDTTDNESSIAELSVSAHPEGDFNFGNSERSYVSVVIKFHK